MIFSYARSKRVSELSVDTAARRAKDPSAESNDDTQAPEAPAPGGRTQGNSTPADPVIRELTHREILEVLSGLLLALFVSNMAGTIVGNALPVIAASLDSTQQEYTWIVTVTLLASTASTPIWGKLSDLFHKKLLLMVGLAIFIVGSLASGAAWSTGALIGARAIQGIGLGAMTALVQAIIGSIIPPRQRGRYMAYTGAVTAVATVLGPLAGGFIVDQPWLGWRWCFWSAVPFTILSMVVLKWRLHVPFLRKDDTKVDWVGCVLVTIAVSALLMWVSFGGHEFAWTSWESYALIVGAVVASVAFVFVESRVSNPIIPLPILTMRTTALACVASIAVGVGMYGATVFLGQYYQLARGYTPTEAGLMTVPMMLGTLISSVFVGRLVTKVGKWKPFVLVGTIILAVGFLLMSTMTVDTNLVLIGVYMTITGLGVGMTLQNLVLAVQNSISVRDVGAASATVTFFRNLGGAVGIQVLGVLFANQVTAHSAGPMAQIIQQMVKAKQITAAKAQELLATETSSNGSLDLSQLPDQIAQVVRDGYGNSIGLLFAIAAGLTLISIVSVCFMKGTPLRNKFDTSASIASGKRRH